MEDANTLFLFSGCVLAHFTRYRGGEAKTVIIGTVGKLGRGKTLRGVMWLYEGFCNGETAFTNLPVKFPHVPIKKPIDFLKLKEGRMLGDELWAILDNRDAIRNRDSLVTIMCLRSRKRRFHVFYTQQYFQVDIRLLFITDEFIKPTCYPYDPERKLKIKPEILTCERWDGDGQKLPTELWRDVGQYCDLYDTEQDPYTVEALLDAREMKEAIQKALEDEELERDMAILNSRVRDERRKFPE